MCRKITKMKKKKRKRCPKRHSWNTGWSCLVVIFIKDCDFYIGRHWYVGYEYCKDYIERKHWEDKAKNLTCCYIQEEREEARKAAECRVCIADGQKVGNKVEELDRPVGWCRLTLFETRLTDASTLLFYISLFSGLWWSFLKSSSTPFYSFWGCFFLT